MTFPLMADRRRTPTDPRVETLSPMFRRRVTSFDGRPQHARPDSPDYDRWGSVPLMSFDPGDGFVPAFNLPEYVPLGVGQRDRHPSPDDP